MTADQGYILPLSAESLGAAPGRGRLAGRRILVVGGGQRVTDAATDPVGNGRAMSLLCAREGARVAVADINLDSARETVAMMSSNEISGEAAALHADVSKEDDCIRLVAAAHDALGGLDGLVLNVGIGLGGLGLQNTQAEPWDRTFAINIRAPMLLCREALPKLDERASILFISSIASMRAGSRLAAYDSSKAALGGLMRQVAAEGARRGIRANILAPGLVDTPLGRAATQGRPSRARAPVPFGRQATAWEIAYAALFFLSDESIYVTGQTLAVDGGITGF